MTILDQIAGRIIKEQELVIGSLAWFEAEKVKGLHIIDRKSGEVSIDPQMDNKLVVDGLVREYELFFGRASHEVCKEAAAPFIIKLNPADIPLSLR